MNPELLKKKLRILSNKEIFNNPIFILSQTILSKPYNENLFLTEIFKYQLKSLKIFPRFLNKFIVENYTKNNNLKIFNTTVIRFLYTKNITKNLIDGFIYLPSQDISPVLQIYLFSHYICYTNINFFSNFIFPNSIKNIFYIFLYKIINLLLIIKRVNNGT